MATHLRSVPSGASEEVRAKIPPTDLDAEAAVLAAVMIAGNPDENTRALNAIRLVKSFLRPEHFYSESHRDIFAAALELHEAGAPVDVVQVATMLKSRDRLERVGGMRYVTELLNAAPTIHNVRSYAATVHDLWRVRQVVATAERIAATGYLREYDGAQAFSDYATKSMSRIAVQNPLKPIETNEDAMKRVMAKWFGTPDRPSSELPPTGYPTGIRAFDRAIGGLAPGRKTGVIALPGVGKTSFAVQAACSVAAFGVGVLFFTSEMDRDELIERATLCLSDVPKDRILAKSFSAEEIGRVEIARQRINAMPIRIDDSPALDVDQVDAIVANQIEEFPLLMGVPLGLVVIDYVQRLEPVEDKRRAREHEQIAHSAKRLKNMAKQRKIAVLELVQAVKNDVDVAKGKWRPATETGVAGSKRIAKELDEAMFIIEDGPKSSDDPREVVFWIPKQRNGKKYVEIPMLFRGSVVRFDDPDAPTRTAERHHVAPAGVGDGRPSAPKADWDDLPAEYPDDVEHAFAGMLGGDE